MRSISEIFADVSAHQIKGLMVHSQLADYYRFLGLEKYANCHEEHYKKEICSWRNVSAYYIEHCNMLVEERQIENPNIVPKDWYGVARQNVDTSTKRRAVENGMNEWVSWEKSTKDLYENALLSCWHWEKVLRL